MPTYDSLCEEPMPTLMALFESPHIVLRDGANLLC
jgi:pantothenate kinase